MRVLFGLMVLTWLCIVVPIIGIPLLVIVLALVSQS